MAGLDLWDQKQPLFQLYHCPNDLAFEIILPESQIEAKICDTPSSIGARSTMTNGFVCCRNVVKILKVIVGP